MIPPFAVLDKLTASAVYKGWKKKHFLSHFFCQLDSHWEKKSPWQIGFFDKETEKIEVFEENGEGFLQKPEDDIFRKPGEDVEELHRKDVAIDLAQALATAKTSFSTLFPQEVLGDGFLILQKYHGRTVWNLTFISKSIQFLNVKIDAGSGEVFSHEHVELIQK